ncbi:hypothetical protein PHLCEN_2v6150 [Hermanssonia centrifuga]|uniref:Uncharacterized protein n=1 Tax=Hermanssonia centrifuga TaxID=98765 RepID=A0A2R6P095_9APHY|nr:hypothetical protein PHLCEN_2v6150 [Hermanssonia centrifuga]
MLLFDGFEQVARDSITDCELMLLLNRTAILAAFTREQDISGFLLFLDTFRLAADPEFVASSRDFKRYIKRALQKIWLTTIVQLNAIPRSDPASDVPRRDEILDQLISLGTHFGLYLQPQSIGFAQVALDADDSLTNGEDDSDVGRGGAEADAHETTRESCRMHNNL